MNRGDHREGLHPFERILLIALFLLLGALGHDPWKQDETYSFGIIYHFYNSHSWLIPMNAGTPFMEKPPLYYWTAVLFARLFSGVLPLHDAARMASVFYMIISCASVWAASRILFRDYAQRLQMPWVALALFLGCFGLVRHAHDMFTDMALLAGTSVAILGMVMLSCEQERWVRAGIVLGLGTGIAFLSKGLLMPIILGASFVELWIMLPLMRTRRVLNALLVALLVASPFLLVWPWLLYAHDHALFKAWFWDNNVGRFLGYTVDRLGAGNKPFYMLYSALWFAFPAFPLACIAIVNWRREWRMPEYSIPFTVAVSGLALFTLSASARALYILPLLPAFALLGAQALADVPPRVLMWWNRLVRILGTACAFIIFAMWLCLLHPEGPQPFKFLYGEWLQLGFFPQYVQWMAIACAFVLVAFWAASFRLDTDSAAGTASLWLVAMTLLWGLAHTLLLPWIDDTRSFRGVLLDINLVVGRTPYADSCIARHNLGESVSPMWEYFGYGRGMGPVEDFNGTSCPLLLLMTGKAMAPVSDPRWHMIWKGSRPLDDKDELQLFERNK